MREYSDKEFSKLYLPVHKNHKDSDIFRLFPVLLQYDSFKKECGINVNYVVRYVVFGWDRNSPLNEIEDIVERRMRCVHLAGFVTNKTGQYAKEVQDMVRGKNQSVNMMIIQYGIMQGNYDYVALTAYEESFKWQSEKLMDKEIKDNEKTKELIANTDDLRQKIRNLKELLLNHNGDGLLERDLYVYGESKKLQISPEDYAGLFVGESVISNE
jgi:hypothetical protein